MADLRDFLQSMSNSAASNVSAPVDGINWLMRKSGLPVSDAPFMGSDWMAQKGFTKPVKQGAASILGETAGMVAPMAIAAKAPQIARGLLQAGENAMIPRTLNPQTGAIVWHGSPHKFDKFDASKIGTGEGAQAYGHGLYLAESPDVAKNYQAALGRPDGAGLTKAQDVAAWAHSQGIDGVSPVSVLSDEIARLENYGKFGKRLNRADYDEAMQILQKGQAPTNGSLYKVDLPDEHIARMLDWDKPLSQQHPDVQKMLEPLGYSSKAQVAQYEDDLMASLFGDASAPLQKIRDPMGSDIARGGGVFDGRVQVEKAKRLQELGIPGIRYLDGGSRGAGAGSSNFVVFPGNEDILKIMERNGKGLLGN